MWRSKSVFAVLSILLFASVARADDASVLKAQYGAERILDFQSDIIVAQDASMDVLETIQVVSLHDKIKHGIYRDFPTMYDLPDGTPVNVGFQVESVKRDGVEEPYSTSPRENGQRVYIGSPDKELPAGVYTYTIQYRTDRQLGFFENFDELYWNVTGNGWEFPIDKVSALVHLPGGINLGDIKTEGYTGAQGEKGKNLTSNVTEQGGGFRTTAPLKVHEGLTVVVQWPKGFVKVPEYDSERILDYHSDIKVNPNASMEVTETIKVVAMGDKIKHGIYRDFPTDYRTKWMFRKTAGFQVEEVLKDGKPEPYTTERASNGTRVKIGSADVEIPQGTYTYTIRYKTDRQLGFFADHDELYWNVTGNGWLFPIDRASATVTLPSGVSRDRIKAEGYTGYQGDKDRDLNAEVAFGGVGRFVTTKSLYASQGLTIVEQWPKGLVRAPSSAERWAWFFQDNLLFFAGLAALVFILAYYLVVWYLVGRDPEKGTIIPLYEAPDNLSPAAVRYIWKMGYDDKVLACALINLGVRKVIRIEDNDGKYILSRAAGKSADLSLEESRLYSDLLGDVQEIKIERANRLTIVAAVTALKQNLKKKFEKVYFLNNRSYFIGGVAVTVVALLTSLAQGSAAAIGTGGFMAVWLTGWSFGVFALVRAAVAAWKGAMASRGVINKSFSYVGALFSTAFALPFVAGEFAGLYALGQGTTFYMPVILVAAIVINVVFFMLLKAPTLGGRKVLDKIEGLKMYLGVAEKDRLNALAAPRKTPEIFEKFLPYALALDVEQEWSEQFANVLTEAGKPVTESYRSSWYSGSSGLSTAAFATAVGASLAGAIASASVAPSSSSGGGGGGSSGGGGGGGGGGGW